MIANCFYPCIKCHLPHNFHYRYSFNFFAKRLGVEKIGKIPQTHATIFQKIENKPFLNPTKLEVMSSKITFHTLECIKPIAKIILKPIRNKK